MMTRDIKQKFSWEILDALPNTVELFEPDGTILYLNKAAIQRHTKSENEILGENIWNLYPSGQAAHRKTVVNKAMNSGKSIQFTDRCEEQWIDVLISPLIGSDGKIGSIVMYSHDITRQIRAEERLKLVSLQLLTNQEDERRRIAQDLHDDIGQSMTALILALKAIHSDVMSGQKSVGDQVKGTIRIVEEMMRHIRQVLYDLRPPSFETTPPAKVLEALCSSLALSTGLRAVFSSQEQLPPMSNAQATALYRLVQEGMNNAAKHAKATSVWINLEYVDGEVNISFEDDGQGFDLTQRISYGIGLEGLRERFLMLNGNFDIESAPGKGTRLYGSLPVTNPNTSLAQVP
jgi:PAS domain S-box-containing protein